MFRSHRKRTSDIQVQFLSLTSGSEAPGHPSACSGLHLCNGELRGMRSFVNCIRDKMEFKSNLEKVSNKIKRMTL